MFRAAGLALALAAGPALAAAIQVRPIPAPNATEIEISTGGASFRIERVAPRQVDLVLESPDAAFNLSAMERTSLAPLISGVRAVPDEAHSRLRFVLACACAYEFGVENGALRMRVMQPTDPSRRPEFDRAALVKPPEKLALLLPRESDAPPIRTPATAAPANRAGGGRGAPRYAPEPRARHAGSAAETAAPDARPGGETEVALAKQHLLRQLSRAAEQGLVDFTSDEAAALFPDAEDAPRRRRKSAPESAEETGADAGGPPEPAAQEARPEPRPGLPEPAIEIPLRARTARDRDFDPTRRDTILRVAPCLEPGELDLALWARGPAFIAAVATQRARLVDEYDDPVPDAVEALARTYLVNGFGAEAIRLMEIYGDVVEDRALIVDLGRVVDGRMATADGPIAASAPCSGEAVLWRRAGGAPPAPGAEEQEDAMIDAFSRLPHPVRFAVAPQLIASLVDLGRLDMAQRIDLVLSRSPATNQIALDFARARLLQASGELMAAEALYTRLARRRHPATEEALIRLANSLIERGAEIPQELTDALTVSGRLARGGPNEAALKVAEARARAESEGLAPALDALAAALSRRPADAPLLRDAAHAVLERARADRLGALAYTQAVMDHVDLISQDADGDAARRQVAEELNAIGLANAALDILGPSLPRRAPGVRRAAARAHVSLSAPEDALILLDGLEDPDAKRLRAEAYEQLGRLDDAVKTMDGAAPAELASLALRAGDWPRAAQSEDRESQLLAKFMAERERAGSAAPISTDDTGRKFLDVSAPSDAVTLGQAVGAVDASRAVRTVVSEALKDG